MVLHNRCSIVQDSRRSIINLVAPPLKVHRMHDDSPSQRVTSGGRLNCVVSAYTQLLSMNDRYVSIRKPDTRGDHGGAHQCAGLLEDHNSTSLQGCTGL